jgi:hypothetical protein
MNNGTYNKKFIQSKENFKKSGTKIEKSDEIQVKEKSPYMYNRTKVTSKTEPINNKKIKKSDFKIQAKNNFIEENHEIALDFHAKHSKDSIIDMWNKNEKNDENLKNDIEKELMQLKYVLNFMIK